MSDTQKQLQRAYKLINKQKASDALAILQPLAAQEPDNPDIWWLMAYALDEPFQVREALIKLLRLNPDHSKADKARELLKTLNEQHPPTQEEIARYPEQLQQYSAFPDAFAPDTDDLFASSSGQSSFGQDDNLFSDSPFTESYDTSESTASSDQFYGGADTYTPDEPFDESVFMLAEEEITAADTAEKPAKKSRKERQAEQRAEKQRKQAAEAAEADMDDVTRLARDLGVEPDALDDEILAELEEKAVNRKGKGSRILRGVLALAVVAAIAAAALILGTGGEDKSTDPGPLKAVSADAQPAIDLAAVDTDLLMANLGAESHSLIADSKLGSTLFVEFCRQPGLDLPSAIIRGMDAVARQVPEIEGLVDAVGVSVNNCTGDKRDSLYRASVSMEDATVYNNSMRTAADVSTFQTSWKTP